MLWRPGAAVRRWASGWSALALLMLFSRAASASLPRPRDPLAAAQDDQPRRLSLHLLRPRLGLPGALFLRARQSRPAARAVRDHRDDDGGRRLHPLADPGRRRRLCDHHGRRGDPDADDHATACVITAIGPLYTGALLMMVLINGRAFMQRKYLDFALEEREQTVSLLLREYESSDADWLWQTNAQLGFHNVSARFARAIGRDDGRAGGHVASSSF